MTPFRLALTALIAAAAYSANAQTNSAPDATIPSELLGASLLDLSDVPSAEIRKRQFPVNVGLAIVELEDGGLAGRSGFRVGDIIVRIGDSNVPNSNKFNEWESKAGDGKRFQVGAYRLVNDNWKQISIPLLIKRLAVSDLKAKADERIIYIPKDRETYRHSFVTVEYHGSRPTEGFFQVNGNPMKMDITADKTDLLRIDKIGDKPKYGNWEVTGSEDYTFSKPGDVKIIVRVGNESKTLPVHIVEIPLSGGESSAEVIRTFGWPDEKKSFFVGWPNTENIDGMSYTPDAGAPQSGEHWRYKKYPGMVLSIMNGKLMEVGSCSH